MNNEELIGLVDNLKELNEEIKKDSTSVES